MNLHTSNRNTKGLSKQIKVDLKKTTRNIEMFVVFFNFNSLNQHNTKRCNFI